MNAQATLFPAVSASALDSWYALQIVFGLRPQDAVARLRTGASPRAMLAEVRGAPPSRAQVAESRAAHERARASLVPWGAPAYPARIARLDDAPPALSVRGDPARLLGRCVAIVGARAASGYGLETAQRLGREAARAGLTVVSGLARGIDRAAHLGALEADGATIAFQACGIDRVYPPEHRKLADRIVECGAVVAELCPGTPPRAPYFPLRNRLISAIAHVVVIVEARERSGTLVTARHALDQGVEVLAVPGPIDAPTSRGPNLLLRDGARPLLAPEDLLDAAQVCAAGDESELLAPELAPEAALLLAAVAHAPATPDELGQRLSWPAERLAASLLELELAELVREERDGRFAATSRARGAAEA